MIAKPSCVVFILVSLIVSSRQKHVSPCPEVFSYEYTNGEWSGIVTVPSAGLGDLMKFNVTLSVKNKLPSTYTGHVELLGDRSEVLLNIINGLNIKYKVALPALLHEVPLVTLVVFNGRVFCEGPPASDSAKEIRLSHVIHTGIDLVKNKDSIEEVTEPKIVKTPPKAARKNVFYPINSNVFNKKNAAADATPKKRADINFDRLEKTKPTAPPIPNRFLNREFLFVSDALPETPSTQKVDVQSWLDDYDKNTEYPNPSEENDSGIDQKIGLINTTPKQKADQFADDSIVFDYAPSLTQKQNLHNFDRLSWNNQVNAKPETNTHRQQHRPSNSASLVTPPADLLVNDGDFVFPSDIHIPETHSPYMAFEPNRFREKQQDRTSGSKVRQTSAIDVRFGTTLNEPKNQHPEKNLPVENSQNTKFLEDFLFPDE